MVLLRFLLIKILLLWFGVTHGLAQSTKSDSVLVKLEGVLLDEHEEVIPFATVLLRDGKDSAFVKGELSDSSGYYQFKGLHSKNYFIEVQHFGYAKYFSDTMDIQSDTIYNITLDQVNELGTVDVVRSIPFIERKMDRIVVNPDALIAGTGGNAIEILELAPGVLIDQNGQVSYKGRTGVAIYINEKPSYLSGSELENYLRSLPAGSIKNIEIIENPPAKYDAAGNAGIININIKRNTFKGFFGDVSLSYRRSRYNTSNNSLNLNYNKNKISFSANLNGGFWESFQDLNINRYYLDDNGVVNSAFNQNSFNNRNGHYLQGRFGIDFYPTDRTTLGLSYKRSTSPNSVKIDNTSLISDGDGNLIQRVIADNLSEKTFENDLVSFYLKQLTDTLGSAISLEADYVEYRSTNDQVFRNFQYTPSDLLTYSDQISGEIPSKISIYAAKLDYSKPFKNGSTFSTGIKSAYTETDNEAIYWNTVDGQTLPNYDLSNRFLYDEWINAGYLNYNMSLGKIQIQIGLRGEATRLNGNQLGNPQIPDTSFTRAYFSLFPTLYVARALDSLGYHTMNLSFGRRIERPYFQDLNPFISPLDKFTYYTGNPNLLPTYSNNLSLSYGFKHLIALELAYAHISNGINETLEIEDEIYYSRPGNISSSYFLTLSTSANIPVTSWYSLNLYAQASYVHFQSQLYTEQLNSRGINLYTSLNNSISIKKGWKINFGGQYVGDQVYSQLLIKRYFTVNCGVQKSLFNGKGSLRLNASDLFYSRVGDGVINNLNQTNADWNSKFDSRSITLTFSLRFGKSTSSRKGAQGSGSESEQKRVKS